MAENKRDGDRVEILGDLRGEVMVYQPFSIKEISQGGCLAETAFPLQLDSLHDLRLTLADRSVVVKGRVAHCRIGDVDQETVRYLSGLEFVDPSERIREAIDAFIDAVRAARRPA